METSIVKRKRGRPPKVAVTEFSKEFVKEAQASDKRVDKGLNKGNTGFFEAIVELISSGDKGYYQALGFSTFEKYRESKTAYSRSHIGQGLQVYRALHGRIPDDKFMALPLPVAVLLTKIPDSKVTEALVDQVSTMTIQDFKEQLYPQLTGQLVDATTGEAQPVTPEEFAWVPRLRVHSQVADRWKELMEMAREKARGLQDENDIYADFTLDEKALIAIYTECFSTWEPQIAEATDAEGF